MSDLQKQIINNILAKKFNKANDDFSGLMKDKTFDAIKDFKTSFKYTDNSEDESQPTPDQEVKDG